MATPTNIYIANTEINIYGELVFTYSDGSIQTVGNVLGKDGIGISNITISGNDLLVILTNGAVVKVVNARTDSGDGIISISKTSPNGKVYNYTILYSNGNTFTFPVTNTVRGKGDAVTIVSISESTEDGGPNVVTFSDGTSLTIRNGSSSPGGGTYDIVVPGTNSENPLGTAGLVRMYNTSSGLRLDEQKRLCVAPADENDINAGTSHNKPIVPHFLQYALKKFLPKVTNDDINIGGEDEMLPPTTHAVRELLNDKAVGAKVKFLRISPTSNYRIRPGTVSLILPYDGKAAFYQHGNSTPVIKELGAFALVFASERTNSNDEVSETGTNYWISVTYVESSVLVRNHHNKYSLELNTDYDSKAHYISNTHSSGYMYVYYLSRW